MERVVDEFDYDGIQADDETTLRNLATEIGQIEKTQSESWLTVLAPKYAEARRILKGATGRQFGKRWNQWLALQPTGGKSRTGDKLAKAHELVDGWGLSDGERTIIARYRSVICDLAAPTMPKEIQEEFRPRLLAGEDVTRDEVKERRREYDTVIEDAPADGPSPTDLPEPEPAEGVEELKARIAELEKADKIYRKMIGDLETENADLKKAADKVDSSLTLNHLSKLAADIAKTCTDKSTSEQIGADWPSILGIEVTAEQDDVEALWREISHNINTATGNLAYVTQVLDKIRDEVGRNRIHQDMRQTWDSNRRQGVIIPESEMSRRILPHSVKLKRDLWAFNYKGYPVLTKKLAAHLREKYPGRWGACHTAPGKYIVNDDTMWVRFSNFYEASEFKVWFG